MKKAFYLVGFCLFVISCGSSLDKNMITDNFIEEDNESDNEFQQVVVENNENKFEGQVNNIINGPISSNVVSVKKRTLNNCKKALIESDSEEYLESDQKEQNWANWKSVSLNQYEIKDWDLYSTNIDCRLCTLSISQLNKIVQQGIYEHGINEYKKILRQNMSRVKRNLESYKDDNSFGRLAYEGFIGGNCIKIKTKNIIRTFLFLSNLISWGIDARLLYLTFSDLLPQCMSDSSECHRYMDWLYPTIIFTSLNILFTLSSMYCSWSPCCYKEHKIKHRSLLIQKDQTSSILSYLKGEDYKPVEAACGRIGDGTKSLCCKLYCDKICCVKIDKEYAELGVRKSKTGCCFIWNCIAEIIKMCKSKNSNNRSEVNHKNISNDQHIESIELQVNENII